MILPPLIKNIDFFTFSTVNVTDWKVLGDDMSVDFELDSFKIINASMDYNTSNVKIIDNEGIIFRFQNLQFGLSGDYSFITDPPIFADIGEANFFFAPTNFSTGIQSEIVRSHHFIGEMMQLTFSDTVISA